VNGSSNGGGAGGEKRPNGSAAGNMSLTGREGGTASRTGGGRSGNGTGSHSTTGGISTGGL